jgi:hypothetical protein
MKHSKPEIPPIINNNSYAFLHCRAVIQENELAGLEIKFK